ncbi:hypothetical protein ONE63_007554 [Megalurothrips usitatus]|uniref:DnaJ homolog subfamily C member 16 n=1 Tax=Megalurothrips usitatus TaxID=439358 RepID=A0AAV7XRF2_9NEOP|nr:hypothetical protein ONE63_007554 [Megalurothrips usitatus]
MIWKVLCIIFCLLVCGISGFSDPYRVLGIPKSSTIPEIRKAYKNLAKEWHPDKNHDPAAEEKFVEITQAYELLSDPERRKQYDLYGVLGDSAIAREKREYNQQYQKKFDFMDELFGFPGYGSFRFRRSEPDITSFHKLSVTTKAYENNLVPKSFRTPYLILFYTDWCFSCLQIEPLWRKIIEELEPIGVGIATVHSDNEKIIAKKVGVKSQPTMVLLMEGKTTIYREPMISAHKIVEFIRGKFPYNIMQTVTDDNVRDFLGGWLDNRVRALVFENKEQPRLRYLLTAYHFRDRVAFGSVNIGSMDTAEIQHQFKVAHDADTLLVFNENHSRPIVSLSMADIPVNTMQDVISRNKYLVLPRLSSQTLLDALCPPEWAKPRKRLCVVLVSENTPYHDSPRQALRQFAQDSTYNSDRVRFTYIFQERQSEFINALTSGEGSPPESTLHIVILWRRDASHIKYEWLPSCLNPAMDQWNDTKSNLESTIQRLLQSNAALSGEAIVKELIDEHAQGMVTRMVNKLLLTADFLKESIGKDQILPAISVLGTILFIIGGGYLMAYLVRLEEESIGKKKNENPSKSTSENGKNGSYVPELKLHEMRAENYNGLVRLIKPGCRTIILLVDMQSRSTLLPSFHKTVWPYRKNKTLMFAHLSLERGLEWYKRLLTLSLPEPRELNINPRNCIGTVLSLNGHRKYFCMYHAKHPECTRGQGSKRMVKMTKHFSNPPYNTGSGAFMGFDTSESESENDDIEKGVRQLSEGGSDTSSGVLFQRNLLDGLPNWLDRLFEGSTHRYYVNYWPDFTGK